MRYNGADLNECCKLMKSLCIYCGSRPGSDPEFAAAAKWVGEEAARRGWRIVYGGGKMGLMGVTAGAARDAGGKVYGVIPEFLVELEGILDGVDHTVVKTMHERKMIMFEEADAICALPGGIGTLEELIETLSWARLALHSKPIIVLNMKGFWSPLKTLFEHVVAEGFAPSELLREVTFVDAPADIFRVSEKARLRDVAE